MDLGDALTDGVQFKKKLRQTHFPTFLQPTLLNILTKIMMIPTPWNFVMHLNFSWYKTLSCFCDLRAPSWSVPCHLFIFISCHCPYPQFCQGPFLLQAFPECFICLDPLSTPPPWLFSQILIRSYPSTSLRPFVRFCLWVFEQVLRCKVTKVLLIRTFCLSATPVGCKVGQGLLLFFTPVFTAGSSESGMSLVTQHVLWINVSKHLEVWLAQKE